MSTRNNPTPVTGWDEPSRQRAAAQRCADTVGVNRTMLLAKWVPRSFLRLSSIGAWVWVVSTACSSPKPKGEAEFIEKPVRAISVEALTLSAAPFRDRVEATGSLRADRDVVLSARSSGTLTRLQPLGTQVKKGQVVATIDPAIPVAIKKRVEAGKRAAEVDLQLATQTYERQKRLHEEGVISDLEFQSIQARYLQSEAALAQAEAQLAETDEALANTKLVAPFSGKVDQHFAQSGEQIGPQMPVARVIDASVLLAKAGFPERYAADIKVGDAVEVRLSSYGLEPKQGKVRFVSTAIDPRSRTFEVEVEISNPSGQLKPEMVATLVVTRRQVQDALVVPEASLLRDEVGLHVFVVGKDGAALRARRRSVSPLGRGGGQVMVEGLKSGEQVITVGQTQVIDGDFVSVESSG